MAFVRYNPRFTKVPYIRVSVDNVYVSALAYEFLNKPIRVAIYYDKENEAIKIEADEFGSSVHTPRKSTYICARISKFLPMRRYYLKNGMFL